LGPIGIPWGSQVSAVERDERTPNILSATSENADMEPITIWIVVQCYPGYRPGGLVTLRLVY
jgi:hypothetical protein